MSISIYRKLHDGRTVFKKSDAPGEVFFSLNDTELEEICNLITLAKPAAWVGYDLGSDDDRTVIYESPQYNPLSDDEILKLADDCHYGMPPPIAATIKLARAIEKRITK